MTIPEEISPPATEDEKKYIQRVLGSFLYYAHIIDLTILHTLSVIASEQAKPTKQALARVQQLLDYMATDPSAVVRFYALRCFIFISKTKQKHSWRIFLLKQCTKGWPRHTVEWQHPHYLRNSQIGCRIRSRGGIRSIVSQRPRSENYQVNSLGIRQSSTTYTCPSG